MCIYLHVLQVYTVTTKELMNLPESSLWRQFTIGQTKQYFLRVSYIINPDELISEHILDFSPDATAHLQNPGGVVMRSPR